MLTVEFDGEDVSVQQSRYEFIESSFKFDGTKEITISFYKPINSLFINCKNREGSNRISLKYFNGIEWTDVKLKDLTFGLTRSGFVSWSRNLPGEKSADGMYSYKLQILELDGSQISEETEVKFKGINLVFSDDWDLLEEYPSIMTHLPDDQESFIRFHASARDEIITDLRNAGIVIGTHSRKQVDQWDLLDKNEVREASKFSTLSKIFKWLSDTDGDRYDQLAKEYQAEAGSSLSPLISLDRDDDGRKSKGEQVQPEVIIVGRL
jgi:hypothetical protein